MSNLMQLKHRIKSIETTKKVTHAMRLIAISFYGQAQKQNNPLLEYQKVLLDLLHTLYKSNPSWKNPLFIINDHLDSNPLIIVISTSRGLCGSFHENLAHYFNRVFYPDEHQTAHFITVGQKATSFIKKQIEKENYGTLVKSFEEVTLQNIHQLTQKVFSSISNDTPYSSVTIYSNKLISFFSQKPTEQILLPFTAEHETSMKNHNEDEETIEYIWEQDKNIICDTVAQTYLKSCIESILMQSLLAEQAARFLAMENATTSATQYIEALSLQYNKTRQDAVTKEISELSAAM